MYVRITTRKTRILGSSWREKISWNRNYCICISIANLKSFGNFGCVFTWLSSKIALKHFNANFDCYCFFVKPLILKPKICLREWVKKHVYTWRLRTLKTKIRILPTFDSWSIYKRNCQAIFFYKLVSSNFERNSQIGSFHQAFWRMYILCLLNHLEKKMF